MDILCPPPERARIPRLLRLIPMGPRAARLLVRRRYRRLLSSKVQRLISSRSQLQEYVFWRHSSRRAFRADRRSGPGQFEERRHDGGSVESGAAGGGGGGSGDSGCGAITAGGRSGTGAVVDGGDGGAQGSPGEWSRYGGSGGNPLAGAGGTGSNISHLAGAGLAALSRTLSGAAAVEAGRRANSLVWVSTVAASSYRDATNLSTPPSVQSSVLVVRSVSPPTLPVLKENESLAGTMASSVNIATRFFPACSSSRRQFRIDFRWAWRVVWAWRDARRPEPVTFFRILRH
jgi:hypothetical protein